MLRISQSCASLRHKPQPSSRGVYQIHPCLPSAFSAGKHAAILRRHAQGIFALACFAALAAALTFSGCRVTGSSNDDGGGKKKPGGGAGSVKINFDPNGGIWLDSGSNELREAGQTPEQKLVPPERETEGPFFAWDGETRRYAKYDFVDWYTVQHEPLDKDAPIPDEFFTEGLRVSPDTIISAEMQGATIYALWREPPAALNSVTFKKFFEDGAAYEEFPDQPVMLEDENSGVAAAKRPQTAQRDYYTAGGSSWYLVSGGTLGASPVNLDAKIEGNITLVMKWTGNNSTLKFDRNYSTGADPQDITLEYPKTITSAGKTVPAITRTYYDLDGWYLGDRKLESSYLHTPNEAAGAAAKEYQYIAKWSLNAAGRALKAALQDSVDDANDALNAGNAEYDDDYIIGSGLFEGAGQEALNALLAEFNALLAEAASLLEGTTVTKTAVVENGLGGTKTVNISYVQYDFDRIAEVTAGINDFMTNHPEVFTSGNTSQSTLLITETGKVHSITVATAGVYEIELYGGSGGHLWSSTGGLPALGGSGGHVKGRVTLNKDAVLKVRVGGEGGKSANIGVDETTGEIVLSRISGSLQGPYAGGWNGGGKGGKAVTISYSGGSGGGGATDVRLLANPYSLGVNNRQNGVNTTNNGAGVETGALDMLTTRIIVAGGGGGGAQSNQTSGKWPGLPGGNAGPVGVNGFGGAGTGLVNGTTKKGPRGGTQAEQTPVEVNGSSNNTSGSYLGIGGSATDKTGGMNEGSGGGGGGYYGGEAFVCTTNSSHFPFAGAGGSNYIAPSFQSTGQVNDISPFYGVGKATIKYVSP